MRVISSLLVALLTVIAPLSLAAQESAADWRAELDVKIGTILPKPEEERWLQIPWRTDFAAARVEADRDGRPLFLWMMDGHPLGCT